MNRHAKLPCSLFIILLAAAVVVALVVVLFLSLFICCYCVYFFFSTIMYLAKSCQLLKKRQFYNSNAQFRNLLHGNTVAYKNVSAMYTITYEDMQRYVVYLADNMIFPNQAETP